MFRIETERTCSDRISDGMEIRRFAAFREVMEVSRNDTIGKGKAPIREVTERKESDETGYVTEQNRSDLIRQERLWKGVDQKRRDRKRKEIDAQRYERT